MNRKNKKLYDMEKLRKIGIYARCRVALVLVPLYKFGEKLAFRQTGERSDAAFLKYIAKYSAMGYNENRNLAI